MFLLPESNMFELDYSSIMKLMQFLKRVKGCVKVVSPTFLLVCFVCLKESTFETRKNVFYFTSKALFEPPAEPTGVRNLA